MASPGSRSPHCCRDLLLAALLAMSACANAQLPADLRLVELGTGFSNITGVHQPDDGSGRLFVLEQSGRVRIFHAGSTLAIPFLRLCGSASVGCFVPPGGFAGTGERGLLGLAFHPQFVSNRQVYVHYSDAQGDTAIARVLASEADPDVADTNSFTRLIEVSQDFSNHNGGAIQFGPDGYLYIGLGDGGSRDDPCARAQTLNPAQLCNGAAGDGQTGCPTRTECGPCTPGPWRALLGKLLRIDVDQNTPAGENRLCAASADGSAPYAVPIDNPYAASGPGCAEVWVLGLRNPWRFSFDRSTDDFLIADVGQDHREEVNLLPFASSSAANMGWRCREGLIANPNGSIAVSPPVCDAPPPFVDPVFETDQADGNCSITGGYRYRGPAPSLQGLYFFADLCDPNNLRVACESAGAWSQLNWAIGMGTVLTFGEDTQGQLYVGTTSRLLRIEGDVPVNRLFADGFEARTCH